MLVSLPPELIQAISHELKSIEDIKSFRLTCKLTDAALATEILRRITVDVNKDSFEKELCKLQYFAEGSLSSSIREIREIDIKSLSPAIDPDDLWEPTEEAAALESYEGELKKCLFPALSSLTSVMTVRWTPGERDSEWAQIAVIDALESFPDLQSLHIDLLSCRIEIPFHSFTALRHVSLNSVGEYLHHEETFENFAKMISQSPLLESIDFSHDSGYRGFFHRSLRDLFYPEDENYPPLRLKHLSLARCFVRLDDKIVMRHLRYLTSLSLDDLLEPSAPPYPPYLHSGHGDANHTILYSEKESSWGSNYEQIWRTICNTDWKLEEITTCATPSTFIEYIGSYSGLKKLKIGTGGFKDAATSDSAANKFYEVLEKHADSIKELDVMAHYEDLWCFGHHNKALFSAFRNLTTLGVRVQSSDFAESSELGRPSSQDIIKVLIDTVLISMPKLQALSASIASPEHSRGDGTPPDYHHSHYRPKIVARVLKYEAPFGCKRLPMFTAYGSWLRPKRVFVGRSPNLLHEGERLRYEEKLPLPGSGCLSDNVAQPMTASRVFPFLPDIVCISDRVSDLSTGIKGIGNRVRCPAVASAQSEHMRSYPLEEDERQILREHLYGKFSRTLQLPQGVKDEQIKATMENGVLTVTFPKNLPELAPKKIAISEL